jgi:putative hemolysin
MLAEGVEAGVLHALEHGLLEGVMRTADRTARAIMTPRVEIRWIEVNTPAARIAELIATSGHSRFPVARGRLDGLIGIVEVKDLAVRLLRGEALDIASVVKAPLIVPDGIRILRLLERFREAGQHAAVVVDEYGAIEGIVTPQDILTSIAGELPEVGDVAVPEAVRRGDGSWLIDGRMDIHEAERLLGLSDMAPTDEYATLAGFVLWQLRRLPRVSDSLVWRGWRFEVVDMDGRRIDKLLVAPLGPGGQAAAAPAAAPGQPGRPA